MTQYPLQRLLAISTNAVWPVADGLALRIHHLLVELARDWEVTLIAGLPSDPAVAAQSPPPSLPLAAYEPIALAGRWRYIPSQFKVEPLVAATQRALARQRPTAVLLWPGAEFLAWTVAGMPRSVADRVDSLALTMWRAPRGESVTLLTGPDALRRAASSARDMAVVAAYERKVVRRLAATVVAGHDDAAALRRCGAPGVGRRVHVIPNGVALPVHHGSAAGSLRAGEPTVVFTGTLNYEPNITAARQLAERIWPLVARAIPAARLVIAGRNPTPDVAKLAASPGISVLANVANMDDVLATAWVCAAPMISGSGVKNKVLEAWAHGRPVVMSRLAGNGLPIPPGHDHLILDDPDRAAGAIVRLLQFADECARLGSAARQFVPTAFSWHRAGTQLSELLRH